MSGGGAEPSGEPLHQGTGGDPFGLAQPSAQHAELRLVTWFLRRETSQLQALVGHHRRRRGLFGPGQHATIARPSAEAGEQRQRCRAARRPCPRARQTVDELGQPGLALGSGRHVVLTQQHEATQARNHQNDDGHSEHHPSPAASVTAARSDNHGNTRIAATVAPPRHAGGIVAGPLFTRCSSNPRHSGPITRPLRRSPVGSSCPTRSTVTYPNG